ncbi:MAG: hypothetical protein ACFFBP_03250 [Promethearchaeota archaeon]
MKKNINQLLDFLSERVKTNGFILHMERKYLFEVLKREEQLTKEFNELITSDWNNFNKNNVNSNVRNTYTTFFYDNFDKYFKSYLSNILGFDENSFHLSLQEKISDSILIMEYKYYIPPKEDEYFTRFFTKIGEKQYTSEYFIGFFFRIVEVFGIKVREFIQDKFYMFLDHVSLKNSQENKYWHMMIVIKDSKDELRDNYYKMNLIWFLKQFKGIPGEFYDKLLNAREKLYNTAINDYSILIKDEVINLFYYFYKKSTLIQNISPLLDILNFVCSRVEDSKFSKLEIIRRNFLGNLNYSNEKNNSLIKLFKFIDTKSSLYTTFASNNLPSPRSQFDLFLLYMKYYFASGLEALEVGDLLFLPRKFSDYLNQNKNNAPFPINANTLREINLFMDYFSIINHMDVNYMFFQKIFGKTVSNMNFWFFSSFLRSINEKFFNLIEEENELLSENPENSLLTFDIVIDHICRMIYVLIERIFIRESLEEASDNFMDPRGRYVPKNIALRIKELFLFQDMNFSDDIWPIFVISLRKKRLKKALNEFKEYADIPDRFFYNSEDIFKFLIYYNFKSYSNPLYLEEWLINGIINPFNKFIQQIKNSVDDPSNNIEIYEKLSSYFLDGINDDDLIQQVKFICQKLAPFWGTIE